MKKFGFALVGAASLALAACSSSDEDSLTNVDLNADAGNLDALAHNAADVAAEAEALGNQAQQLEQEATNNAATDELNASTETEGEENVSGM
jgi:hypothetical protein